MKTAVVRALLPNTAAGTVDITASGIGTISAAIGVANNANATNNPQNDAVTCVGFYDGTNQRSMKMGVLDNQATSDSASHALDTVFCMTEYPNGVFESRYTASTITDGIRLTMSQDGSSVDRYITVLLISGVDAKVLTFTPNSTQDSTQESASLGFAPRLVSFITNAGSTATTSKFNALLSWGWADENSTHRAVTHYDNRGQSTTDVALNFSETRCVQSLTSSGLSWGLEVTTFGSDTFTTTKRDAAAGNNVTFCLALGGDDLLWDIDTLTTPASTGDDTNTVTNIPSSIIACMTTATSTGLKTNSEAEGVSYGMADNSGQYSHSHTNGDNLSTSNARSIASASALIDLDDESSGFNNLADATLSEFTNKGVVLNYTAVPGTAVKGWMVTFGKVAILQADSGLITITGTAAVLSVGRAVNT